MADTISTDLSLSDSPEVPVDNPLEALVVALHLLPVLAHQLLQDGVQAHHRVLQLLARQLRNIIIIIIIIIIVKASSIREAFSKIYYYDGASNTETTG